MNVFVVFVAQTGTKNESEQYSSHAWRGDSHHTSVVHRRYSGPFILMQGVVRYNTR